MLPVSSADDRTGRRSKVPAPCTLERRLLGETRWNQSGCKAN